MLSLGDDLGDGNDDDLVAVAEGLNTIDDMLPIPASKVDPLLMIDGKPCHKSTIVRCMLSSEGVSTDCLKHVRGYSKFEADVSAGNLSETLVVGDPICSLNEKNISIINCYIIQFVRERVEVGASR